MWTSTICVKSYGDNILYVWCNDAFSCLQSHGVIFVVDSSATERINECKEELHRVLQDDRIKGKPIIMWVQVHVYPGLPI